MKRALTFASLLMALATPVQAQHNISPEMLKMMQDMHGMSPDQQKAAMTQMYTHTRKAQECFKKLDQAQLAQLKTEAEAVSGQIKKFCAANQRAEAEQYAKKAGVAFSSKPIMKELRACSEEMASKYYPQGTAQQPVTKQHMCDSGGTNGL